MAYPYYDWVDSYRHSVVTNLVQLETREVLREVLNLDITSMFLHIYDILHQVLHTIILRFIRRYVVVIFANIVNVLRPTVALHVIRSPCQDLTRLTATLRLVPSSPLRVLVSIMTPTCNYIRKQAR